MKLCRIQALLLRYLFVYRNPLRSLEAFFWPVMDLLVWGFVTHYLESAHRTLPAGITFLIGAMIFWDILYRSQQGLTLAFLEDVWSRNVLNLFSSPLHLREFLAATYLAGLLKTTVIAVLLTLLAYSLWGFNLWAIGTRLAPLTGNLILMGWSLGMLTTGLILRWGQAAEALAWAVPFFIQPFAAVFYPLAVLPSWVRRFAWFIPATHVFEGLREVLSSGQLSWNHLLWASGLNAIYLLLAGVCFYRLYTSARVRGLLTKLGTH
ncbi:ABC transporter permease [Candidatus Methylacidithermus pantelleriae]|uniref:Transport permease protein n=1 Tax=Candidatus Methylacidithermus pantelleriae TaxID=2744239 RepID=A0A8J2BV48_9BACT|nr:ABC transporter permease [Candidatus Methylacidithermus pantelleriae]CAF0701167.1 Transport permease protein [Candidatus Methylacidithermus pantelleriae]